MIILAYIIKIIFILICVALGVGFYTLFERKTLSYIQARKGPNKPGFIGLPQPLADAAKLFRNESLSLNARIKPAFLSAPLIALIVIFFLWTLFSSSSGVVIFKLGILFFLAVSRVNVYVTLTSGWASNSKYALLGATRGVAQTISYEIRLSLILITVLLLAINFNLTSIQGQPLWFGVLLLPLAVIWIISSLAETNRAPFDLAEGESELVSGFNIEYGRGTFAFLFIAEYGRILVIRILTVALFLGRFYNLSGLINALKISILAYLFLWVRGRYPRIRYDTLIYLTWKTFLSVVLVAVVLTTILILLRIKKT